MQKDSWAIDYQATLNALEVAKARDCSHFVLLSAVCVQKPLLQFQHAKLAFEAKLREASGITYSIVRPTAFFKSLAGQVCCTPALLPATCSCTDPTHGRTLSVSRASRSRRSHGRLQQRMHMLAMNMQSAAVARTVHIWAPFDHYRQASARVHAEHQQRCMGPKQLACLSCR